jgi:hypothetical protein
MSETKVISVVEHEERIRALESRLAQAEARIAQLEAQPRGISSPLTFGPLARNPNTAAAPMPLRGIPVSVTADGYVVGNYVHVSDLPAPPTAAREEGR